MLTEPLCELEMRRAADPQPPLSYGSALIKRYRHIPAVGLEQLRRVDADVAVPTQIIGKISHSDTISTKSKRFLKTTEYATPSVRPPVRNSLSASLPSTTPAPPKRPRRLWLKSLRRRCVQRSPWQRIQPRRLTSERLLCQRSCGIRSRPTFTPTFTQVYEDGEV